MTDTAPIDASPIDTPPTGWNPLPARARPLFLLGGALSMGVIGVAGGVVAGLVVNSRLELDGYAVAVAIAAMLALAGTLAGLWIGYKSHRYTLWRLDDEGLAVHRGKLWQRETRVPATRVQHLDLRRGPLQRRRDLATLIVHTAGTAHSSISVPNLDLGDAEALRDRLGRQIDHDDDD